MEFQSINNNFMLSITSCNISILNNNGNIKSNNTLFIYPNITSSVKKLKNKWRIHRDPSSKRYRREQHYKLIFILAFSLLIGRTWATQAPLHHEDLEKGQTTQRDKRQNPRTTFTHQEERTPANRRREMGQHVHNGERDKKEAGTLGGTSGTFGIANNS